MEWTKERPTVDGWYWIRSLDPKTKGMKYHVVMVMAGWVHNILGSIPFNVKEINPGELEWYGPLTPPS